MPDPGRPPRKRKPKPLRPRVRVQLEPLPDWHPLRQRAKRVMAEYTPKLKASTYGSDEYKGFLEGMGEGLRHHYEANRHHPEHFPNGVNDMTLVDLMEMLADWKAATERHADGDVARSLRVQKERFGISDQLAQVLHNTVEHLGWWSE